MRILLYSFYFQPDLCAGSFRCTALVEQLLKNPKVECIDVITTLPNRYASFSVDAPEFEQRERLNIHRIALPSHKSGMVDQAKSFSHYFFKALKLSKSKDYDLVVATSSRLFTAFLGKFVAARKKLPVYLDIRDIFIDTLENILPKKISFAASPVLKLIEKYTFTGVAKVNLVSPGFKPYFESKYPKLSYDFYSNGIDNEFVEAKPLENPQPNEKKVILYAGNLGESQGLHRIVPQLAAKLGDDYQIKIIGDGGRKTQLAEAVEQSGVSNVSLLPPVNRQQLITHYQQADILFLHLNDYEAFEKVLPSKVFEYGVFSKPILAGVSGYAAKFVNTYVSQSAVFYPCDADAGAKAVASLPDSCEYRQEFVDEFLRKNIMQRMTDSIVSIV